MQIVITEYLMKIKIVVISDNNSDSSGRGWNQKQQWYVMKRVITVISF